MITFVLVGLAVGMFFWIRYRWRLWVKERAARRTITAQERAKAKAAAKRRVMQRVHALLPDRTVRRLMRWTPETRPRPTARIARRGFRGRYVRVNPAQHILAVGMTGSGKTSTLRVLGAWALRTPGWHLEIFDAAPRPAPTGTRPGCSTPWRRSRSACGTSWSGSSRW